MSRGQEKWKGEMMLSGTNHGGLEKKGIKPCTVVSVKIFIVLQNAEENAAACVMQKARPDNDNGPTWP